MKQLVIGVLLFLTFGCEVSNTSDLNQETPTSNLNNTPLPNLEPQQYRFISFDGINENGGSQRKSAFSGAINWALLTPILDDASINLSSELVAVFGAITEDGFYIHKEQALGFSPEAMEQANGNIRSYFYEFGVLQDELENVQRVAIAYIPDSELAQQELTTWLSPISLEESDSLMAKKLPDDTNPITCYYCFSESPQDFKIIAPSLSSMGDLTCTITYCDGTEATVTAPSLEGDYSVTVDFDWIISGGVGGSSSSGGGSSDGDGSSGSTCLPPHVCGNPEQAPDEDDSEENEEIPEPCEGDPLTDPKIAPQKNSGVAGGRQGKTRKKSDGTPKDHNGIDLSTNLNDSIYSMYSGTVIATANQENGWGNWILIQSTVNNTQYYFLYARLNSVNILTNSTINAGTIIGTAGDSGNLADAIANGFAEQHTHIEVRQVIDGVSYNNSPVKNPEDFMKTKFDSNGNPIESTNCNN